MKEVGVIKRISTPIYTISLVLAAIAAIGNLAASQIHIAVIVKIFQTDIGFYFFLFIIFGLVTFMNGLNIRKTKHNRGNNILLFGCAVLATLSGIKYIAILLNDIKLEKLLTMDDILLVLVMSIASVIVYSVGTILILLTQNYAKRGM